MPFTGNPSTSAIDRVRLMTGDILEDMEFLTDDIYQYVLDKNEKIERAAGIECARYILGSLARFARERAGDYEYYGSEFFRNYKDFLLLLIQNPHSGFLAAMPYAGGISRSDQHTAAANPDRRRTMFYERLPMQIRSRWSYEWG